MQPTLIKPLFRDLKTELCERLRFAGFELRGPPPTDVDRVMALTHARPGETDGSRRAAVELNLRVQLLATDYFQVFLRSIPPTPRQVLWSRELQARALPSTLRERLARVEALIVAGEPLGAYQSKSIEQPTSHDGMLNAWNIHHLHLLTRGEPRPTGDDLLFVVVQPERALLIDIGRHADLGSLHLLDIVDRNWPDALGEPLTGVVSVETIARAPQEWLALWAAGLNVLAQLSSGRVVMPTRGMFTTGLSGEAGLARDVLLSGVFELATWIDENEENLRAHVCERTGHRPRNLDLSLRFQLEQGFLIDRPTSVSFPTRVRFPILHYQKLRASSVASSRQKRKRSR